MENIIRAIVSNRLFILLFFFILLVAAWIKLPDLRISQYPVVKLPTLMVSIVLPGASANELEQRVVNLIEDKLQNTRRLFKVTTQIHNSYATIVVRYDYGVDIDDEYVEINSKINSIKSRLPDKTEVTVLKQSPIDLVVSFVLGVASATASEAELRQASDLLSRSLRQLGTLEDIQEIEPEEEIRVDLDLARIESARLSVATIESTIQGINQYLPTGTFDIGDKSLSVLAFGNGYRTPEEIRQTLVMSQTGTALTLGDFADVRRVHQDAASTVTIDGVPAMLVTMKLNETANIYASRKAIAEAIAAVKLPEGVDVVWLFDAQAGVDYKLKGLVANIATGIGILALVLLFAVGIRSSLIIASTLPAALILSVIGLAFTDYGIQEISLAGFIIALGLIVDNGIVVTENAYKLHHYQGFSRREAAIMGTSSVVMPLFSSTATTVLAFAPLFLLTSTTGLFLHSLVAVIWLCLGASLVAAIVISSVMLARIGTENRARFLPSPPSFLVALIPFRDTTYRRVLDTFIRHPFVLLTAVLALLVFTGFALSRLNVILFPPSEDPFFTVSIEAPQDRNRQFLEKLVFEIDAQLRARPEIAHCSSVLGMSFPMVHTGSATVPRRRNTGQIFCSVDFRDANRLASLIEDINASLDGYEAVARIKAAPFSVGGTGNLPDLSVQLKGPDIRQVRQLSAELEQHIKNANIDGVSAIDNDAQSRYFALHIDYRERHANALGVNRRSVDQALVLLTHGKEIDRFRDGSGDEIPIMLRVEADSEDPLGSFDRVFVSSATGARIPLSQVVEVAFEEDEYDIEHNFFQPQVEIDVTASPGNPISQMTARVKSVVEEFPLPAGFTISYAGKIADQADSFGGMSKYVGIVGLVVLAILVLQFGSISQPLIVCVAIPLSFIGAFLLLYFLDQPMTFLAFIGLTSLMGIVINNSILLVDEGNHLRLVTPGESLAEIAIQAGRNRFMPIVLTTLTSIVGLLPLALGDTMFKALAIAVIGGLFTSMFLTLICVPVLYANFTRRLPDAPAGTD